MHTKYFWIYSILISNLCTHACRNANGAVCVCVCVRTERRWECLHPQRKRPWEEKKGCESQEWRAGGGGGGGEGEGVRKERRAGGIVANLTCQKSKNPHKAPKVASTRFIKAHRLSRIPVWKFGWVTKVGQAPEILNDFPKRCCGSAWTWARKLDDFAKDGDGCWCKNCAGVIDLWGLCMPSLDSDSKGVYGWSAAQILQVGGCRHL